MDTKSSHTNPPKRRKVIIRRKVKSKKETEKPEPTKPKSEEPKQKPDEPTPKPEEPCVNHYISTMDDYEKRALNIAKESLGSSFDIEDSLGYKEYIASFKKE